MKTAVETIFAGKVRQYNRRFLQMCRHYFVEPVDCTPASGWEKGQVENQVGLYASASSPRAFHQYMAMFSPQNAGDDPDA